MPKSCSVCKQPLEATKCCTKCRCIQYCSKECQRKDWPYHKTFCKSFAGFWKSQDNYFQKLDEPLSSKMLVFWLTVEENLDKIKELHPEKHLVAIGHSRGDGFAYDIKCLAECKNSFNEMEIKKIERIMDLVEAGAKLVVYKLHVDDQNYELIHTVIPK